MLFTYLFVEAKRCVHIYLVLLVQKALLRNGVLVLKGKILQTK